MANIDLGHSPKDPGSLIESDGLEQVSALSAALGHLIGGETGEVSQVPGRGWIRYARLTFAGVICLMGIFLVTQAFSLGYSEAGVPGPGFFPLWVGLILASLALYWGFVEFRTPVDSQVEQDLDPKGPLRVVRMAIAVAVVTLAFVPLGYNISVLVFMLFLTFTMGKGSPYVKVVVSLAASFGVYLAFQKGLAVTLPGSFIPFLKNLGL